MGERAIIQIDTGGTAQRVADELAAMPAAVDVAQRRALRKLQTWVRRQVLRAVAQAAGTTQKRIQALLRWRDTIDKDGALSIWIGTNPIKAHHLGTVHWTRRMQGARVGRRSYPGAWSWGDRGKTGPAVMRRTGPERLPIEVVREPIHDAVSERVSGMLPEIQARFAQLMLQELRFATGATGATGGRR